MALDPTVYTEIVQALAAYLTRFPEEAPNLELLRKQIADSDAVNDRRNFNGHITGSAIVLSPDRTQIALIHHNLFERWQQPGGHWEETERDPLEAARREAIEETGVTLDDYLPLDSLTPLMPLDIDTHEVPARPHKDEPVHFHHDLRYVFVANSLDVQHQADENSAVRWFPLNAPETAIVHRAIDKLRRLLSQ